MKTFPGITALCMLLLIGIAVTPSPSAAAPPDPVLEWITVTGTGNPEVDIPAVQSAVDQGGQVVLAGHFSFDGPATTPAGSTYARIITVSRDVVISGARDERGAYTTIEDGNWPFFVDAANSQVTIEKLHFVGPSGGAVWAYAVAGLNISNCQIEGVVPTADFGTQGGVAAPVSAGLFVGADPHPPSASFPGKPSNFSGNLIVEDNDIDMAASPDAASLGVVFFSVGTLPDHEVTIDVSRNRIRNVTEPTINFRVIGGRAYAEHNVLQTGGVKGPIANPDAIRIVGTGSYVAAHNSIDCGWSDGEATAIDVFGSAAFPETGAVVLDNDILMSAAEGTAFTQSSAAIEIKSFAQGNSVLNNRIRGRAWAALAVDAQNGGIPANNSFLWNEINHFDASTADIYLAAGVQNTIIIGPKTTLQDNGTGTLVVPIDLGIPRMSNSASRTSGSRDID